MKILACYLAMVLLTVSANLFFKSGAVRVADGLLGLLNIKIVLGFVCFGLAALLYIVVLRVLPLNVAQSLGTIQFVAVIIAAHLVLGEPIGATRLLGIGLIISGVVLIGRTIT
nr:EamA family transporter [uncultured Pseudogulbenkiania sp.]